MNTPLAIRSVHKTYQGRKVLESIDFALEPGEIFGLVGLNGAGKTTLIKIMLDLVKAEAGEIRIFDTPSTHLQARRRLSYLPEKFQPSRYLKGMEYLDLAVSYYGRKLNEEAARRGAEGLDLDPKVLTSRVGSYSKGMGQKLGLLGAFMVGGDLLVLDEPMSGLDPRARIKLKDMLLSIRATGKTIFFSSHILSDLDEICDRIGIIHDGRLYFIGTPAAFKAQYGESSLEKAFLKAIDPTVIPVKAEIQAYKQA